MFVMEDPDAICGLASCGKELDLGINRPEGAIQRTHKEVWMCPPNSETRGETFSREDTAGNRELRMVHEANVRVQNTGRWIHGVETQHVVAVSKQVRLCANCKALNLGGFVTRSSEVKESDGSSDRGGSDEIGHGGITRHEVDDDVVVDRMSRE